MNIRYHESFPRVLICGQWEASNAIDYSKENFGQSPYNACPSEMMLSVRDFRYSVRLKDTIDGSP